LSTCNLVGCTDGLLFLGGDFERDLLLGDLDRLLEDELEREEELEELPELEAGDLERDLDFTGDLVGAGDLSLVLSSMGESKVHNLDK